MLCHPFELVSGTIDAVGRYGGSAPFAPILLVLGILGAVVLTVALAPVLTDPANDRGAQRRVAATVVRPASCGADGGADVVRFELAGTTHTARYDGCGHTRGQRIPVLVSPSAAAAAADGELVVRPALSGAEQTERDELALRLGWVLLSVSGIAGAGYMLLLRPRPTRHRNS